MQSATGRMQELIRGLLAYSRLNTEKPAFRKWLCPPCWLMCRATWKRPYGSGKPRFNISSLPDIQGNVLQLRQLFQNLLSNALKFTPSGRMPVVQISSQTIPAAQLPVPNAGLPTTYLELSVADNGIGFDDKYVDRIFNLFQRLHGRSEFAGTGIGLAICKKVVDNHGGYLSARSRPGHGATFLIYFPIQ